MKRNTTSFVTGLLTGALLLSLGTTALAASGNIHFNFSNVALNGERKIAAGATITAPNGQQVPSTILYVDEAGGKTNYLPIRAVSQLLGTEIGYDAATKTILLGETEQAAADDDISFTAQWVPDGYTLFERKNEKGVSSEIWSSHGDAFTLAASHTALEVPQRPAETVMVHGVAAQYWEREEAAADTGNLHVDGKPVEGNTVEVSPDVTVSITTGHSIYSKRASVLAWTKNGISFRLIAPPDLDQAEMLRIAEHVQ